MSKNTTWRMEKARGAIIGCCHALIFANQIKTTSEHDEQTKQEIVAGLSTAVTDATKLYFESVEEHEGTPNGWSMELVVELVENPKEFERILGFKKYF